MRRHGRNDTGSDASQSEPAVDRVGAHSAVRRLGGERSPRRSGTCLVSVGAVLNSRVVVILMAAIAVWFGAVVLWASQPATVSTPVFVPPPASASETAPVIEGDPLTRVDVECASAFSSSPLIDGVVPVAPEPYSFERPPCDVAHRDARKVFAMDAVIFLAAEGALGWVLVRRRRSDTALAAAPLAQPS